MAAAAQSPVTISSVLDNVTPKWIQFINSWVRDFPALAYVGLYLPNYYADWGSVQRGTMKYTKDQTLKFKNIWALEWDMTVNANEVVWYEAGLLLEEALVTTANAVADNDVEVESDKIRHFKVGDVITVKPAIGSATSEVQAEVTAVNTTTNIITLDTAVECAVDDIIVLNYNLIEFGTEITRGVSTWDITPVRTYFQTFGESVEFDSNEINQTRLFVDAAEYINSKFGLAISMCNNRISKAWYTARNIAGAKSETQWLEHVIAEAESTFGAGTAAFDLSWVSAGTARAKKIVEILNYANSANVYKGNETPTIYCNLKFITALSEIMFDMGNSFNHLEGKEIVFGLQKYTSPYFSNVEFIVDHTLNVLYRANSVAFLFPRHLTTFKTPEYQSVNENGALVKTQLGKYNVLKLPQTSVDKVKYTAQLRLANIFAGQTNKWAYIKMYWL